MCPHRSLCIEKAEAIWDCDPWRQTVFSVVMEEWRAMEAVMRWPTWLIPGLCDLDLHLPHRPILTLCWETQSWCFYGRCHELPPSFRFQCQRKDTLSSSLVLLWLREGRLLLGTECVQACRYMSLSSDCLSWPLLTVAVMKTRGHGVTWKGTGLGFSLVNCLSHLLCKEAKSGWKQKWSLP